MSRKLKFNLNLTRTTVTLYKDFLRLLQYLAELFLTWEIFEMKVVEKIKTHISYSVTFFFPEDRAVYEVMSKNVVEPERPQTKI